MSERTNAYQFTADPLSSVDNEKIQLLRKVVSNLNKAERENYKRDLWYNPSAKPKILRLCLKARIGKNNPNAVIYRNKVGMWGRKGDYQSIKLEHAQRIDVYIQRRYD